MTDRFRTIRDGLICATLFTACFWIAWPVAQMGFDDDWSYIKTAQMYAQTGHLVYNGWGAAIVGWQALWGALFIRIFGFSFMAVKLSTLPLAIATVFLFYLIQVRFGIRPRNAMIGALTLGLSPMFLPLAASFMTDVPSLFVILLCLYCCQRAVAARSDATAIAWLCLGAASNVAGGTARQTAWLGALVMVPSTAWLLRKRHSVLLAASFLWAGSIAAVLYLMHWYAAQPYAIVDPLFKATDNPFTNPIFVALLATCGAFLCLLLLVFPVMIAWLPRIRAGRGASLLPFVSVLLLWVVFQFVANWTLPWLPHSLLSEFSAAEGAQTGADRGAFIFPMWACLLFSVLIAAAFLSLAATVVTWLRTTGRSTRSVVCGPIFWLLAPYCLSYIAFIFLRAFQEGGTFDRYLLSVMPMGIIFLIRLYEVRLAPRLPAISIIAVAIYALLAIAGTHDWFAWQRARLAAIAHIQRTGLPRTQIVGGFEYDAWTQVTTAGYMNDRRIIDPPGAYHSNDHLPPVANACQLNYLRWTPSIHPIYSVAFAQPMPCVASASYSPVHYRAWLPPFHRAIYIQRFPRPAPDAAAPLDARVAQSK